VLTYDESVGVQAPRPQRWGASAQARPAAGQTDNATLSIRVLLAAHLDRPVSFAQSARDLALRPNSSTLVDLKASWQVAAAVLESIPDATKKPQAPEHLWL
jgi:hypothetical protein